MAQFIPFDTNAEVNGQTVLSVIKGVSDPYKEIMHLILANNGIVDPQPNKWYKQEHWLKAFLEISETVGMYTLFEIGDSIQENAEFPPGINSLEEALNSIDVAYHLNHRGGEIGYYKVLSYDPVKRKARIECKNPYPCHFDRGIILSIVRRFKPKDSSKYDVVLDIAKPNRMEGSDSSVYLITW